jgi:hypothetical protein
MTMVKREKKSGRQDAHDAVSVSFDMVNLGKVKSLAKILIDDGKKNKFKKSPDEEKAKALQDYFGQIGATKIKPANSQSGNVFIEFDSNGRPHDPLICCLGKGAGKGVDYLSRALAMKL